MKLAAKAAVIWIIIMVLEAGNGLLRKVFVELFVDDLAARQIGVVIGSVMVILVAYLSAGWFRTRHRSRLIVVGIVWVVLTLLFEVVIGRAVVGLSWPRIWSDYDVARGGPMPFGLAIMAAAPFIGVWLRLGTRRRRRRASRRGSRDVGPAGGSVPVQ